MSSDESSNAAIAEGHSGESRVAPIVRILIFLAAMWALHHEVGKFHFPDFREYLSNLSARQFSLGALAALVGYLSLVSCDWIAIRWIGEKMNFSRFAFNAFVGFAFSPNVCYSSPAGSTVRKRLFSSSGFAAESIVRVIAFNSLITLIGLLLAAGVTFTFFEVGTPSYVSTVVGIFLILFVIGFFAILSRRKEPLRVWRRQYELPPLKGAVPAVIFSAMNWALSAVVLYALMPEAPGVKVPTFIALVMFAQFVGVLSGVPGGLGVFELLMIVLLPDSVPKAEVLSALLSFRAIYYAIPFALAVITLGAREAVNRDKVSKVYDSISPTIPLLLAIAGFAAGTLLLISSAIPALSDRLTIVESWLPLSVVETAHFAGSIVGLLLILFSESLRRRVDVAYYGMVILLVLGIALSLLKGLDWEQAAALFLVLLFLIPARREFTRSASLIALRFRPGWWVSLGLVIAAVLWFGFASHGKVHHDPDLWLKFGYDGDASRFLRAAGGMAAVLVIFAFWQLIRPGMRQPPPKGTAEDLERATSIVENSPDTNACLAYLGDKRFLFSESGRTFLMFGIQGRTWIVMADPIGDESEFENLIWAFRDLCDKADARPAFYEVSAERAHIFASVGLMLYKLGEEARVPLPGFSLEGSSRKNLRHTKSKLEREGATFEIISSEHYDEIIDDLKAISDDWMGEKNAGEKSFSLGSFQRDYLRHFDFAVVKAGGEIVAFSNICRGADKRELSIDLMRYSSAAPYGVMEYLFIELILWGKEEGYGFFSLGMAPLSGLENRSLAPVWNRIGAQIFAMGEHFYNFKGLRNYKEKFKPDWVPRYLACRGPKVLPTVLVDISSLISGGVSSALGVKNKDDSAGKNNDTD